MGQVTVEINGRGYPIACADGDEDRLLRLAGEIDVKVRELAARVGQIGDAHLMVMASLMVADELTEALGQDQAPSAAPETLEAPLAESLEAVAERVENIAARLESV